MKYDLSSNYRIRVSGNSEEIRILITELCNNINKGSYNELKEDLDNLENIVQKESYNFSIYDRIYYNYNSLVYTPNTSSKEAQKFHYTKFKEIFDKVLDKIENNRSDRNILSHSEQLCFAKPL